MLGKNEFLYDYEKYPLGYIVPDLENKNVEIVKGEKHHGFLNFREAEAWARINIVRVYSDEETGGKGEFTIGSNVIGKFLSKSATPYPTIQDRSNVIGKFLSKSAVDKSDNKDVHLSVLKIIPKVISKSISVEIHPDFLKKNNERKPENGYNSDVLVHRLYGAVQLGNDIYRVKITVKENIHGILPAKPHSYEATKIELISSNLTINKDGLNHTSSISAAKLLKNVEMSYEKGKYFF